MPNLREHLRKHRGEVRCDACFHVSASKEDAREHRKVCLWTHCKGCWRCHLKAESDNHNKTCSSGVIFPIPNCGKRLQDQAQLDSHIRGSHTGAIMCGACGTVSENKNAAKEHRFFCPKMQCTCCLEVVLKSEWKVHKVDCPKRRCTGCRAIVPKAQWIEHVEACHVREDKIRDGICQVPHCHRITPDKYSRVCLHHRGESIEYYVLSIADLFAEQRRTHIKHRELGQRSCGKGNQQYKPALTKEEFGKLTAEVHKYMGADRFPIKPEYRQFRILWQDRSASLITQDTEFVEAIGSAPKLMTEICWGWYDRESGERKIFETKINHRVSVQELYNIYGGRFINEGSLRKVYGPPSDAQTEGMTIEELADCLEEIIAGQEIYLAEWSDSYCDYQLLLDSLKRIGRANIMPPICNTFSVLNAWRFAMTGVPLVFSLSIIHELVMTFDFHLPGLAHRAKPDVLMTMNLENVYFKGTLNAQASTGILRYFKAFEKYDIKEDDESGDLLLLKKARNPRNPEQTAEEWSDEEEFGQSDFDDYDFDNPHFDVSDFGKSDLDDSELDDSELDNSDLDEPNLDELSPISNEDSGDIIHHQLLKNYLPTMVRDMLNDWWMMTPLMETASVLPLRL